MDLLAGGVKQNFPGIGGVKGECHPKAETQLLGVGGGGSGAKVYSRPKWGYWEHRDLIKKFNH